MLVPYLVQLCLSETGTSSVVEIVVTGTRDPRARRDAPVSTTVLDRRTLALSPALTTDQALRLAPSAATFRRSASLVSDPTAQGLNLRGLGPSAVSRALVLEDGVPLNDSYGGWIYWRAVSPLAVERIELTPSGGSALYGNSALGGVVQLFPRTIEAASAEARLGFDSFDTKNAALRLTDVFGPLGLELTGELLESDGYFVVSKADRGPIDTAAASRHGTIGARAVLEASDAVELMVRGGWFREHQNGGTRYTDADVELFSWAGRLTARISSARLELAVHGHVQHFEQHRARIDESRSSETLAATQIIDSNDPGGSLTFRLPFHGSGDHVLLTGFEGRAVVASAGAPENRQSLIGAFVQDSFSPLPELEIFGAVRIDRWSNERRTGVELDPKLAIRWRVFEPLTLRASAYRAFRAPTLNELYRPFQVGTILTAANPELDPEHLYGGELGLELSLGPAILRATGFYNLLRRPVTNVTLPEPRSDGAQRQRQNLGEARIRGVEVEVDVALTRALSLFAGYTLADARITAHPAAPELVGNVLPQDPLHRASARLTFDDPRLVQASLQVRVLGPQFEDDRNLLPMEGVALVDLFVRRNLLGPLHLFASIENLLDAEYLVGRAGVDTIGAPFCFRAGIEIGSFAPGQ